MAGKNLRLAITAGACSAAIGFLVPQANAETGAEAGSSFELAFWQAVAASNDPVLYEAYLKQFPTGTFAPIAQVKVGTLRKPEAPAAPVRLPVPQFGQTPSGAGLLAATPGAAIALRDAAAAQTTAEAAKAAAAAATASLIPDGPVVTALAAPAAPIAPPAFALAASAAPGAVTAALDVFGGTAAMPVGSAALLASLSGDAVRSASLAPETALAQTAPIPAVPTAPTAVLAALGAAPQALPTAAALEAAVASQSTPARLARVETPQPLVRPVYAAASIAPRPRSRRAAMNAGFTRAGFTKAVVSTAAVSVEMPDAARQISPLGIMLGQMVRSQETPGTQFGLQEEVAMPLRPRLMAMPEVALPESFCSAQQRSAFDDGIYRPALAVAEHNTALASAYVRKLRTLYDNYQLSGDSAAQASIAAEAKDFARAANAAGSIHDTLVNQFEDIMTTPVRSCGASQ